MDALEYKQKIKETIFPVDSLVRAIFSGSQRGKEVPWIKVIIRPVQIKGRIVLQFSYFDRFKDTSKNLDETDAKVELDKLIDFPFKNIRVETVANVLNIQFSRKNKMVLHIDPAALKEVRQDFTHDREKQKPLSQETAAPFLKAVGIMSSDGKIIASMQRKYTQINEFLRLFAETDVLDEFKGKPITVVDFGCGNAYLTFATYYYLTTILGLDATVTGVDVKDDLLEKHRLKARDLGWDKLIFMEGFISNYHSDFPPNIVIALHACDTATDDAIAYGIRAGSTIIVTAPCCHHYLQAEMSKVTMPPPMLAIGHDGILTERLADVFTDTFRAMILRILNYRTEVIQFVSTEHTPKNLMIRAFKAKDGKSNTAFDIQQYHSLKSFLGVTPYLETILENELMNVL